MFEMRLHQEGFTVIIVKHISNKNSPLCSTGLEPKLLKRLKSVGLPVKIPRLCARARMYLMKI